MFNLGGDGRGMGVGGRLAITPPGPAPPTPNGHIFSPLSGSPGAVPQDAGSLDSSGSGSIPFSWGVRSPGKVSPLRGRTMKEYEEQLAALRKENFALKLRIYFLEERVGQKGEKEDKEQLYRTNIELKVETEALKQEVYDKQELVREASAALAALEQQYQHQLEAAANSHHQETQNLQDTITRLQKEVDEYAERAQQGGSDGNQLGELTQLCGLAFPTEELSQEFPEEQGAGIWGGKQAEVEKNENNAGRFDMDGENGGEAGSWGEKASIGKGDVTWDDDIMRAPDPATPHPCHTPSLLPSPAADSSLSIYGGGLTSPSHLQGLFSLQEPISETMANKTPSNSSPPLELQEGEVVGRLRERVRELEARVEELEGQLAEKEEMKCALEGDLSNLKKEMEEKEERVNELEGEVAEREERLEEVMKELETQQTQLVDKDDQISSLYNHLNRVQPEMEVKVQEIVERDRIIEEKIEQIEQQNKILVEIQITLDERQKQLADAETKLAEAESKRAEAEARATEANERADKLALDLEKSCKVIQTFAEEVQARDKEIANLKKEGKRKERKIRDLVAELKQTLDMLNKAKWEAETSGGEDGVKEMAEEENERLWAEVEARKNEVVSVRAAADAAVAAAEERTKALAREMEVLTAQRDKHAQEADTLTAQLQQLQVEAAGRESQLIAAKGQAEGLEAQLAETRTQLEQKRQRLAALEDDIRATAAGELDRRALQVDRLQDQLAALAAHSPDQHSGASADNRVGGQGSQDTSRIGGGSGGVDIIAMTQPVQVSVSGDSLGAVHHLYQEVSRVRGEAEALRQERTHLTHQLATLQALYHTLAHATPAAAHNIPTQAVTTPTPTLAVSTTDPHVPAPDYTTPTPVSRSVSPNQPTVIPSAPITHTAPASNHTCTTVTIEDVTQVTRVHCIPSPVHSATENNPCSLPATEQVDGTKQETERVETEKMQEVNEKQETDKIQEAKVKEEDTAVGQACQAQVEALKTEIGEAQRVGEELGRAGAEQVRKHKAEIARLRRRLTESHTACDLLRTRLEELADFLEAILDLEGRGLITLDALPPEQLAALHQSLDQSRALSRSLSQSFVIGMETGEEVGLATLFDDTSTWGGQDEADATLGPRHSMNVTNIQSGLDVAMESGADSTCGLTHNTTMNLTEDTTGLSQNVTLGLHEDRAKVVQALAARLTTQLDQKTRELDAIAESVSDLTNRLANRTNQVTQQAGVISQLRSTVDRLTAQLASQGSRQDHSTQDSGHSSDPLPPPPLHLLRDSEFEAGPGRASEPSSLGAIKSAYSTDAAIKAHSGRLAQQLQQEAPGESGAGAGMDQWMASPSESEAWSEPDRNVSLARIGLDATTLAATPDRPTPRPRQPRTSALTSESEGELPHDDVAATPVSAKPTKRRSDVAELRRVSTRLKAVEQLNDTLRAELHLYHTLTHHLQPHCLTTGTTPLTTIAMPDAATATSATSDTSHSTRAAASDTITTTNTTQATSDTSSPSGAINPTFTATLTSSSACTSTGNPRLEAEVALAAPLLAEVRGLRAKLEEAIANNDHLRDQLEAALSAHPHEEARFLHLTAALQTAQEDVREARERCSVAQGQADEARAKAEQAKREADETRTKLEEERMKVLEVKREADEVREKAEEARVEVDEARNEAMKLRTEVEEAKSEAAKLKSEVVEVKSEACKVSEAEVTRLKSELTQVEEEARAEVAELRAKSDAKIHELIKANESAKARHMELEDEAKQMAACITTLEDEVRRLEAEAVERERKAAEEGQKLEEKERRLLEVNKERLALVGERARLHARLTTQVEDKRRMEVEKEQLVEDKKRLCVEKEELKEDRRKLMEEIGRLEEEQRERGVSMEVEREKGISMERHLEMEREKVKSMERDLEMEREKGKSMERDLEVEREKGVSMKRDLEMERERGKTMERDLEMEQEKGKTMERDLEVERKRGKSAETGLEVERERWRNMEAEVERLRTELEAERRVTEALQQRLDDLLTIHSPTSTSASHSDHLVVLPAASDASHESVTSLEYFPRSSPPRSGLWGCQRSLSPTPTPTAASPTPLPPPPHYHRRDSERSGSFGSSQLWSSSRHEKDTSSYRRERDLSISKRERERSASNKREKDTNVSRRESSSRREKDLNLSKRDRELNLGMRDRESSINKQDRELSINKRILSSSSSHWSEDKENLLISATDITTTTSTTTTTIGNKRSCRLDRGTGGGILALSAPNLNHDDDDREFDIYGDPDAYGDGETTSGESPDLGIGSDHHFSSLERGTTTTAAITMAGYYHTAGHSLVPHSPPSLPTQLCSEPSHSTLSAENERLRGERDNLAARLTSTMATLQETHQKLSRANQRKETVERAICKQLHKTHHVLQRANAHIRQANSLPQ